MKEFYSHNDSLVLYTAEDIQKIFKLKSIAAARKLMNHPAFPTMRIGKALRVTEKNLIRFIEANQNSYIDLL